MVGIGLKFSWTLVITPGNVIITILDISVTKKGSLGIWASFNLKDVFFT